MALVMNLKGAVGNMDDQDINIKVDKGSSHNANTLTFDDILLGKDRRITTLLIRFPSDEILPRPDFFEEANRLLYLGGQPRLTTI